MGVVIDSAASEGSRPAPSAGGQESRPSVGQAIGAFAPFVLLTFVAAIVGGQFIPGAWYAALEKPAYNPPNWIFGPVWGLLYVCIGVSAGLYWQHSRARLPVALWCIQLALNATWSWIFFGLHQMGWALAEIGFLWLAIAATATLFWRVRRSSGLLLVPYLLWVTFASLLNWELWRLNP